MHVIDAAKTAAPMYEDLDAALAARLARWEAEGRDRLRPSQRDRDRYQRATVARDQPMRRFRKRLHPR